jgi:AbiV family abortive infection protein
MPRPLPNPQRLLKVAQAAAVNAGGLLDDARLLLGTGRWARAHALGTLALEEFGKATLCVAALQYSEDQAKKFWSDFTKHQVKLGYALSIVRTLMANLPDDVVEAITRVVSEAETGHGEKLAGLYVDIDNSDNATILSPVRISEAMARQVVADAGAVVEFFLPAWTSDVFDDKVGELLDEHWVGFSQVMGRAMQLLKVDPDAATALAHRLVHDGLPSAETEKQIEEPPA